VKQFEKLARRPVRLITNGFDEDDFRGMVITRPEQFTIRHVGIVNEKCDPRPFMKALKNKLQSDQDFARDARVEFIGEVHPGFKSFVSADAQLKNVTDFVGNVPHETLLAMYGSSSLFLLILTGYKDAEGFMPGKLFEYLATGLPVLGIGPVDGDAANLLKVSGGGAMIASEDIDGIGSVLSTMYEEWKDGVDRKTAPNHMKQYSRRAMTGTLVEVLQQQSRKSTTPGRRL
jgi:glycosyltransferase involved in cell wall biosynthesis